MVTAGSLEGNVSWAPDLWGAVRRNIEASKATAQASAATLANATLSEQTALATAVIELRVTDANIDLLQQTVTAFKESLRVVSNQGVAGTTPPSDVITARTQLENTQSSLIALGVARAQFAHAIAVLAGKNPEDLDIAHSTQVPTLPPLPAGVPSTLLQRRPDIAVAERQMAAANAADRRRRGGILSDADALGCGWFYAVTARGTAARRKSCVVAGGGCRRKFIPGRTDSRSSCRGEGGL